VSGPVARDRLRRHAALLALGALSLLAAACAAGGRDSADAGETRTVLVDYSSDRFATSLFEYFPKKLPIRAGDTVEFKQIWTGEPHSVTMGRLVDEKIEPIVALLGRIEQDGNLPPEEPEEFMSFGEALPYAFDQTDDDGITMAQNAAQPCYVDGDGFDGTYPGDARTPCPNRVQPEFNGRQAIYNSGIIPYEGVGGNTFKVRLADDIEPGTYTFYCNIHGPLQYGQLVVQAKGTKIPGRAEIARQARREAEQKVAPLLRNYEAAKAGKPVPAGDTGEVQVETAGTNLIGVPSPFFVDRTFLHGVINEFVPRTVETRVGQKTTWTFVRGHTISFNVPKYFPVFTIADDGNVTFNSQASKPLGWPDRPKPAESEQGGHEDGGDGGGGPPEPVDVDAGPWDGRGFRSTGLNYQDGDKFSITFTRAGSYTYACLIHPQMVGKVVVKA
jgi:plastocyanin